MMITICVGSSCHVKGSDEVVARLEELLNEHQLKDQVELTGTFCIGRCQEGVCVMVDGEFCSVSPASTDAFFEEKVLKPLKG